MNLTEIKHVAERQPFRPFVVRLTNGSEYTFTDARDFGAPRDFHMIVYFGESEAVRIDVDHIAEIIEKNEYRRD
jgi:hypothetical protein